MQRRTFIKLTSSFVVSAALPGMMGGCDLRLLSSNGRRFSFPQGVASGDPQPDSIVLWTRMHASPGSGGDAFELRLEVAEDPTFVTLIVQRQYPVSAASDFTLRVYVDHLQADTHYFYRFIAPDNTVSRIGRTRTSPLNNDFTDVTFAFASCQDRIHGFYRAYQHMIDVDKITAAERQIRFVLHLGDFVYETRNDELQQPVDEQLNLTTEGLFEAGHARRVDPFPNGGQTSNGVSYAETLADYRHLYKQFLQDAQLQAARARWPFVHVWDDHEFSDDCWQSEANYEDAGNDSTDDEPSQQRKIAANQAWYEFTPVDFRSPDGAGPSEHHASEFVFAEVENTPNTTVDDNNLVDNPANLAAINSLTIYRRLRYGANIDLLLTDCRSYRSDHAIPEDLSGNLDLFVHPRVALPIDSVNQLDAGRNDNNSDPDTFVFLGTLALNPRRDSPPGTVLGERQKGWWKTALLQSGATWKLWANSIPLMRMGVDLENLSLGLPNVLLSGDAWDGYAHERRELVQFIRDNDIANVVSLAGDVHAHFCGEVKDDFDAYDGEVGLIEAVCASVSSPTQFTAAERYLRNPQTTVAATLRRLVTYDAAASRSPGVNPLVNNLNNTLLNGALSGLAAEEFNTQQAISDAANPDANPHLRFADTHAHGYGLVEVSSAQLKIKLVAVDNIIADPASESVQSRYTARFTVLADATGSVSAPTFEGEPPFPFSLQS